ncbi:uncharacterized protein LOC143281294 [Babylonia areolata]|uniref:uncharacterized protein LOC143281294 n=1 Tax=Babylonia areolata TaxID=304850 RepID=UPI003FD1379E
MLVCPPVTAPQPGASGDAMAVALVPSSPLSPFSFWQDLLDSAATDDYSADVAMTTAEDNINSFLAIVPSHQNVPVSDNSDNGNNSPNDSTIPTPAVEVQPSPDSQNSSPNQLEGRGHSLEGTDDRKMMLELPTDQHFTPLTTSDSLVSYHHHQNHQQRQQQQQLSDIVSETANPLNALAAIAEQHPAQVHHQHHRNPSTFRSVGCSGGVTGSSVPSPVTSRQEQTRGKDMIARQACQHITAHSKTSLTGFDVSKVETRACDVCGEPASGHYFGALVCLPCKSFFIRCTKGGEPAFSADCGGKCDVIKSSRIRCQYCRFQRCLAAGMYRKEKPEAVVPEEGQVLCKVCNDIANGVHFGVTTCEGCKKFFRRGLKEYPAYVCKANRKCTINPRMRNNCRYCRYQKCMDVGMSREAIKMGRPRKKDSSSWRSTKLSGAAVSREAMEYCSDSALLGEGTVGGVEDLEEDSASLEADGALGTKFSLEAMYDSSCIADEFLEAVSMGLDQSVKSEPIVCSSSPTAASVERTPVTVALSSSPSSSSSSPLERGSSIRSATSDVSSMGRPVPFSPLSGDTCLPQACPDPPLLPSSGFPLNQLPVSSRLPQQSSQPEVGSWRVEEEAMPSSNSGHCTDYADTGHSECCAFSSPFLDIAEDDCPHSPPCCCNSCSCSSPISDCDSPCCLSDYRSQMHHLPSAFTDQQLLMSSHPQLSVGHERPDTLGRQRDLAPMERAYPTHAFAPPHIRSLSRQQCVPQAGQIPVVRRHRALPANLPFCPHGRCDILESHPGSSLAHCLNDCGVSYPDQTLIEKHIEENVTDELSVLESLRERASASSNIVQNARNRSEAYPTSGGKQDPRHADASTVLHNQGISFGTLPQLRQDSRRRQSDSQLEYVPNTKVQRISHRTGTANEVTAPWISPVPANYRSEGFADIHWSVPSSRQSGSHLFSSISPLPMQRYKGSTGMRLSRSFSHNSLHLSNREFNSTNHTPAGVSRVPQLPFLSPNWQGFQYGTNHYPAMLKQGAKQSGTGIPRQFHNEQSVFFPAHITKQFTRQSQNPGRSSVCQQSVVVKGYGNRAAFSSGVTDSVSSSSSVDPLATVSPFLPDCPPVRNDDLNSRANLSAMTTALGNGTDAVITSSTHVNSHAFPIQRAPESSAPNGSTVTTNVTSSQSGKSSFMNSCKPGSPQKHFSLGQTSIQWPPTTLNRLNVVGGMSAANPASSLSSPVAAEAPPAASLLSCPTTCEGTSSARVSATDSPSQRAAFTCDPRAVEEVNRHFLTLENTCDKNACGEDPVADVASDGCQSQRCPVCHPGENGQGVPEWQGVCLKRWHRYWHGWCPPSSRQAEVVRGQGQQQQFLTSVAAAFCQFRDNLCQLHKEMGAEADKKDQTTSLSELLQRLNQQSTVIAAMTRRFLSAIPGSSNILPDDSNLLSQRFGFSSALILLSSQAFDPEGRRFREVLNWTVGPTSPLFCFKVQLLAVAASVHALAMDSMETAVLCALSVCSTDTCGLKDTESIQGVRGKILESLETCVSATDQSSSARIKRLLSVLPDVRLISAWFCALLSHSVPPASSSQ